jgi:hypothetical protein
VAAAQSGPALCGWVQTLAVVGGAPAVLGWLLATLGVALVVTKSRIGAPLRRRFPVDPAGDGAGPDDKVVDFAHLLRCPMCVGWWVGVGLSPLGLRLVQAPSWAPSWPPSTILTWALWVLGQLLMAVENGFAAAAWCWAAWVALAALGAERQ